MQMLVSHDDDEHHRTWTAWTTAVLGSFVVGLSGLVPLLVIPTESRSQSTDGGQSKTLRRHLSFAVGGLLGDVFLHLLPEAYGALRGGSHGARVALGLWILTGILSFLVLEKVFEFTEESKDPKQRTDARKIVGYLNLFANCVDNFIHGLAVASSFLASLKLGLITVFAILIHEIPHEVGDFAILLNSGFTRWEAGKAQFCTATVGMLGACAALWLDAVQSLDARTSWILPFSAGGFLNIALVSVLPELMRETDPKEALVQLAFIVLGIAIMAVMSVF